MKPITMIILAWMTCAAAISPTAAQASAIGLSENDGLSLLVLSFLAGQQQATKAPRRGSSGPCGFIAEPDGKVDHDFSGSCRKTPCSAEEKEWCNANAVGKVCDEQAGRASCVPGESNGQFSCYVYCG